MPDRVRIEVRQAGGPTTSPVALRNLRVVDEAGAHLVAKAQSEPTGLHDFTEGMPVVLTWGLSAAPVTSLMYVHRVGDISSRVFYDTAFDLMLVGASWPLKSSKQRALRNVSAEQVMATIAGDHGLSYRFTAVNRTFDLFVSRTSDWVALRDLAKRVGGMLRVDGTTLRIFDLNDGLARVSGAPVFSPKDHNMAEVKVTAQRQDSRRREVTMVHPGTKSLMTVDDTMRWDDDDLALVEQPSVAVGSPTDTQQGLRAERLSERFREVGEVTEMRGEPRLRPGEVLGLRDLTPHKNGFWTVTKADHRMGRESFSTRLELGRSSSHPRGAPDHVPMITGSALAPLSGASLRQGKWVSS